MTAAVTPTPPLAPVQFSPCCDWVSDICKKVHDFVMNIINSVCLFFSPNSAPPIPIAATHSTTVHGPLNLVAFYRGLEPNNYGVTLDQILNWDDDRLEAVHTFIQWIFPLVTPSGPNPTAAVLDHGTIQLFRQDPGLQNQVLRSLRRMLSFYGLQMDEATRVITRAPNFPARSAVWLTHDNHNFLRISRIIHSLNLLGLAPYSRSVFNVMQDIYRNEGRGVVSDFTYQCWRGACPGN